MQTRKITTEAELAAFETFMAKFWAGYPKEKPSDETMLLMSEDCAELPLADLEEACKILRRRARFLPHVSEIYAEVEAIQRKATEQRLLVANNGSPLAQMKRWKREPMPLEVKEKLQGIYALMDKMKMPHAAVSADEQDWVEYQPTFSRY